MSQDFWPVGIVIALCAVAVLTGLVFFMLSRVRRTQLGRTPGTFEGFYTPLNTAEQTSLDGPWQPGIFRIQRHRVEILKMRSISPLPAQSFDRHALELTRWRPAQDAAEAAESQQQLPAALAEKQLVWLSYQGKNSIWAVDYDAYAGLAAWLEARQSPGYLD